MPWLAVVATLPAVAVVRMKKIQRVLKRRCIIVRARDASARSPGGPGIVMRGHVPAGGARARLTNPK
ncbi:hypothetical protein EVAR_49900_1 [Eumeta japonica]|uniref:Uncharacterized protein n=1 Tax=Eumeta variegata TaxID=151549 RepID=A0A4C1Y1A6_EUMVA|nr:hypothetical protein EVAR_49900_1 [Eumeta japonica]